MKQTTDERTTSRQFNELIRLRDNIREVLNTNAKVLPARDRATILLLFGSVIADIDTITEQTLYLTN